MLLIGSTFSLNNNTQICRVAPFFKSMLVLLVLLEGLLLSTMSSSSSITKQDDEQLHPAMMELYGGLNKVDISKRSTNNITNYSNYFQGQYLKTCKSCGQANGNNFLIIQGQVVSPPYKYPWMVQLRCGNSLCGGAIISEYFILTAAHCLYSESGEVLKPKDVSVLFLTNTYKFGHPAAVQKIIPYPKSGADIGLLKLRNKIICDKYKNPICLPPTSMSFPVGTEIRTAGWGQTESGKISDKLQEGSIQYVDFATCGLPARMKDSVYCFKEMSMKSTCYGDSGSPAFYQQNKKFYVIGTVSGGTHEKCTVGAPFYFVSVPKHVDWIKKVMKTQ